MYYIQPDNHKSVQEWVNQGIRETEAGDNEAALSSFTKALKLEPKNMEAGYKQGVILA